MSSPSTSPAPIPQWITEHSGRQAERKLETLLQLEQERVGALILASHAAGFWHDFLSALDENVRALRDLNLSVTLTIIRKTEHGPQLRLVAIIGQSPFYRQTHSTIEFSLPAGTFISSRAVTGEHRAIRLVPLPEANSLVAIWEDECSPLSARQAAEALMQEMFERIYTTER